MSTYRRLKTVAYAALGFLIRWLAIKAFKDPVGRRVEVSTPISSWRRSQEAVHLWNSGMDPYLGDIFHEFPISLQLYKILINYFNLEVTFAALDVIIAILLKQSTFTQLKLSARISNEEIQERSMKVFLIYLFSPVTIISCTGMSTSLFTNLLIAVILSIIPSKPFRSLTCVLCALLACNNLHFSTLILPVFLCLEYCSSQQRSIVKEHPVKPYYLAKEFGDSIRISFMICTVTLITLISTSYMLMGGSWTFLKSTYLFVLKIQDLTPNIGMLWYLMTEMFEQFLDFFTWIVQINAFVHIVPLSIWLRDHPFLALYSSIITTTITQPYSSLANIGLITSLIPQWAHLIPQMSKKLIVSCACIACSFLWIVFWDLWIVKGTANSNFYFGATLAFSGALILFLIDLLKSHAHIEVKTKFVNPTQDKTEVPTT